MNVVVLRRAQIGAEALARHGGKGRGAQAEGQRDQRHHHHEDALFQNIVLVPGGDAHIHDVAHHQRDQQLKDRL